ncbi:MAG: thiamine pyrophosphate-binding protein [Chloroflexi bacterium]|nr:thiamine pyrophosphate-binding protein [Chloroflexota bacterium]
MISASRGIARILKAEGTPFVSLFPSCRLNNAIGDEGGLPMIMMRDERYGVAVADAFSRLSDGKKFGVCTMQGAVNAAGLEYATGAITQAFEDSSPVLCLTDGVAPSDAGNSHYRADRLFSNITKWVGHIDTVQRMPDLMARAFTYLKTGRPGPVLVQVATNLGEYDETENPYEPVKGWKPEADPDDVKAAVKALLEAKKPLLYVGDGIFYADGCAELRKFAEMAQVPVLTTLKAKSAFPENHALSIGVRGEPADYFLNECDLILAIGSSLSPNRFSHAIPNAASKTIIQCTIDSIDINKSYRVKNALIGDAKLVLNQLIDELGRQTGGGVKPKQDLLDEINGVKAKMAEKYMPLMTSDDTPINPYRVYGDMMKTLDPNNSFVTGDSGSTRDQLSTVYQAVIPHGFLGWGNVSTLGFSLAGAIASKLAHPERQAVNVTGDAGVGYMLGNLEAPLRYDIGITTIHINNSGFAGYGPGFWGSGQDPYTCDVTPYDKTNLARAVEGLGIHAERVTEPKEIIPALKRALDENDRKCPAYIEVICSQYPVWGTWAGMAPKGTSRSQYKTGA